ncbi:hypothetical protein [Streptomyces sp. NPDC055287]
MVEGRPGTHTRLTTAAADQRIRRLLAYALQFHPQRRYPLRELASASGYTNSGVRTAYTGKEVQMVRGQINRDPSPVGIAGHAQ